MLRLNISLVYKSVLHNIQWVAIIVQHLVSRSVLFGVLMGWQCAVRTCVNSPRAHPAKYKQSAVRPAGLRSALRWSYPSCPRRHSSRRESLLELPPLLPLPSGRHCSKLKYMERTKNLAVRSGTAARTCSLAWDIDGTTNFYSGSFCSIRFKVSFRPGLLTLSLKNARFGINFREEIAQYLLNSLVYYFGNWRHRRPSCRDD